MKKKSEIWGIIFNVAIFILLEIAALNMFSKNSIAGNFWLSRLSHNFVGSVWGTTSSVKEYFSLKETNRQLALENFELHTRLLGEEYVNDSIQRAKGVPKKKVGEYDYIPAEIRKMSRNGQHNYVIINRGRKHGVADMSTIITSYGVVGIVDEVGENYSCARSFMNSDVSVSARIGREGPSGPMSWDGNSSNGAILREIPLQFKFAPGDTLYTSGNSTIFPPDIPLGVTGETKIINGSVYEVKVTLFQDFSSLRYVMVASNRDRAELLSIEPTK